LLKSEPEVLLANSPAAMAMACCSCCTPRTPRGWMCCAIFCLIASLCFFTQAFWANNLHQSLSPVFTDLDCNLTMPMVTKIGWEGGFHVEFTTGTTCYNPNPYAVTMQSTKGVNVYMGEKYTKVASVQHIPPTTLPPKGTGDIVVLVKMQPTRQSWGAIFGTVFSPTTPIYVENSIELKIDVNMFFMHLKVKKDFTRDCGFNLQLFRGGAFAKVGPLGCAESWAELQIPEVGDEAFKGKLDLYAENIAADEIEKGTMAKDVGLGVAIAAGLGWGVILLGGFVYCVCRFFRPAPQRNNSPQRRKGDEADRRSSGKQEALNEKCVKQAQELRGLKERLAEDDLRRQMASQEQQLCALKARLATQDGLASPQNKVAQQARELKALKAQLARTEALAADNSTIDLGADA